MPINAVIQRTPAWPGIGRNGLKSKLNPHVARRTCAKGKVIIGGEIERAGIGKSGRAPRAIGGGIAHLLRVCQAGANLGIARAGGYSRLGLAHCPFKRPQSQRIDTRLHLRPDWVRPNGDGLKTRQQAKCQQQTMNNGRDRLARFVHRLLHRFTL